MNMRGGGTTFDRVIANEHGIYVRMRVDWGYILYALAIMKANDILRLKYLAVLDNTINLDKPFTVGSHVHIVIENVTKNMGTSENDADMRETTKITIGSGFDSTSRGTWTSTIIPKNVTVELNCEVVKVNGDDITAKCDSETTWDESVFNRIPLWASGSASFGLNGATNRMLFGIDAFLKEGSVPSGWNESIRYNVTGHESNLTIGNQVTIIGLPESFVSHWVSMGAQAYMGKYYAMLVPPDSP